MADQHFLKLMKKYLKDYTITGEIHSDGYCSSFICRYQNYNYIVTVVAMNPSLRNAAVTEPKALTQFTSPSDLLIKHRYALKPSTDLISLSDIESYKMWKNEYWVRKIEENKLIALSGSQTEVTLSGEEYNPGWIPPFPPPTPDPVPRPLIRIPTWAAAAVLIAVVGFGVYKFAGDQPTSYVDSQGNTVQTLSRNEMEDAYALGVQYYEQGNYENAIAELNKVTNKSSVYEEAQAKMAEVMTAYKNNLIEKSSSYSDSGDYETALSLVESGKALIGDDVDLIAQEQNILNTLKMDHINRSSAAEEKGEYAEAFSSIQTASAFLPDDIELKGLYSRLDAMSKAETALADAERYKMSGDYPKLFSSLDDAMGNVSGSTVALSKLTLAYDEYKTTYLNEVEQQIKNPTSVEEYTRAIEALDVAVSIFTDEYDLKQKQEELKMMKTALKAIETAAEQHKLLEFKEMFETLEKAEDDVYSNKEARVKVTETYDAYKTEYLDNLYKRIGEPKTVGEYESAISLLEDAASALPDEGELTDRLNQYKKDKPVAMFEQNVVDAKWYKSYSGKWISMDITNSDYVKLNQSTSDNYGNTYEDCTMFYIGKGDYVSINTYVTYDCENYTKMTGTVAISEDSKSYAGNIVFRVYGYTDDMVEKCLYDNFYPSGTRPQELNIDLSKYSLVKIAMAHTNGSGEVHKYTRSNAWASLILSDFTLSK